VSKSPNDREPAPDSRADPQRVDASVVGEGFPERPSYLERLRQDFEHARLDLNEYLRRVEMVHAARSATEASSALGPSGIPGYAGQSFGSRSDRGSTEHGQIQSRRRKSLTFGRVWIVAALTLLWVIMMALYLSITHTH
jgi:hypothetical protein